MTSNEEARQEVADDLSPGEMAAEAGPAIVDADEEQVLEETYITLAKLPTLSGITGIPYLPITLRFPWLGLLGITPLPTKWYIDFGEPIYLDNGDPHAADNVPYVSQVTDQVRGTIQEMVHDRLAQRRSIFFG